MQVSDCQGDIYVLVCSKWLHNWLLVIWFDCCMLNSYKWVQLLASLTWPHHPWNLLGAVDGRDLYESGMTQTIGDWILQQQRTTISLAIDSDPFCIMFSGRDSVSHNLHRHCILWCIDGNDNDVWNHRPAFISDFTIPGQPLASIVYTMVVILFVNFFSFYYLILRSYKKVVLSISYSMVFILKCTQTSRLPQCEWP